MRIWLIENGDRRILRYLLLRPRHRMGIDTMAMLAPLVWVSAPASIQPVSSPASCPARNGNDAPLGEALVSRGDD